MNTMEAQEIGRIFKEAREKKKLSVAQVNKRSRIHMNVIDDIENGIFTRLGKPYVKSFMRKYAEFLGLDAENMLKRYESVSAESPAVEFDVGMQKKEEEKEPGKFPPVSEKAVQAVLVGALSIVLISLVLVLIGRVKSKFASRRQTVTAMAVQKEKTIALAEKPKPAPLPPKEKQAKPPKSSSVKLTLRARGEVWVKVTEGDKTLFVGVLRRGIRRSWESDKAITVWTGRAEMLDFTVNDRNVGRIADGVVKNIKVSSAGITIDDNWVTRF